MNKRAKAWIIICGAVLITGSIILYQHFSKDTIDTADAPDLTVSQNQPAIEDSNEHSDFGETEKQKILSDIQNSMGDTEILDYIFGNKDSTVLAAAICRDAHTGAETIVAVATDIGIGEINIAAGELEFEYYRDNGIKLETPNTIVLSLINSETDEIEEFKITVTSSGESIHFVLS